MAARQYEVAFALGGKLQSSFKGAMTSASGSLDALGRKIKALDKGRADVSRWRDLKGAIGQTAGKLTEAQAKVKAAAEAMRGMERPTRKVVKAFNDAKREAGGLKNKMRAQRTELQAVRKSLADVGIATTNLVGKEKQLAAAANKARAAQGKLQRVLAKQAANKQKRADLRGQLFDAAALGAMVAVPMKAAMDFESSMSEVRKVVDFDTPKQFKDMGDDIQKMTRTLPMARDEIARLVFAGGTAGIARKELLGFARDAGEMGIAFDMSADSAGDAMAGFRSAFRMTQDGVRELGDQINYLSNTMPTTAAKITDVVQRIGPLGEKLGFLPREIAALGATLTGMQVPADVAATGIKNLGLALTAGDSATKKQRKAFASLGIDTHDMARAMMKDAPAAVEYFMRKLAKLKPEKQGAILRMITGKESIQAIAPLLTNIDQMHVAFVKAADSEAYAGSMHREFVARSDTATNSVQTFGNRIKETATRMGNAMLPIIRAATGEIGKFLDGINDLIDKFPVLSGAIMVTVSALVALKVAAIASGYAFTFARGGMLKYQKMVATLQAGRLAGTFSVLSSVAAALTAPFTAAGAAIAAAGAAIAATPIGWLIAGVVALAAAGYLVYAKWAYIKSFFMGLWDGIKAGLAPVITRLQKFSPAFSAIASAAKTVWGWFKKLLSPVQATGEGISKAYSAGQIFGQVVGTAIGLLIDPFDTISDLMDRFGISFDSIISKVPGLSETFRAFGEMASDAIKRILAPLSSLGDGLGWVAQKLGLASSSAASAAKAAGSAGGSGQAAPVPSHGTGGFFNRPHLAVVGDKPETIIPHRRTASSLAMWSSAGAALGVPMASHGQGGASQTTVTYSPTININGNADRGIVGQALQESETRLRQMISRIMEQDRRLSLA